MKSTVFLGGGRITNALVAGLRLAGYGKPIVVHDRHLRKLRQLRRRYGVIADSNLRRAVEQARLLIIAVRPDSVSELLKEIGRIDHPLTIVSLAAGIPLSRLRALVGPPVRWARAMPSPVCRSGRGLTALTFTPSFPRARRREVRELFTRVGPVLEIPETKFDAFTVAYSSSHGYHALATLAGAAEKLGLDHRTALIAASHALADGIVAWREGNVSLRRLLHDAATPGGISATVLDTLDASEYQRIIGQGLRAGMARARKNAKPRSS